MLKKIAALLLVLCMLICLSACNKEETSSDISSDISQTQTTDSQTEESSEANTTADTSTQTSENTDKEENSSTPQSSTSKPTSTTNSNTSSTSNPTDSSKPSSTTSKPTETSKPTTSSTPSTSTPLIPSTPTVTKPDFNDIDPRSIYAMVMTNPTAKSLSAEQVINFCLADLYWDNTTNVSSSRLYEVAQNHFVVDENLKQLLKSSSAYDSSTDTYNINLGKYDQFYMGWMAGKIKSYEDLGNNQYMIYGTCKEESLYDSGSVFDTVNYKTYTFKAKVSKTGSKTIIHTFEIINSIPSGVTEY